MGLMGSLYVGTSGLQTSQNALNTTAHNLSNINTNGYSRQQVLQGDKRYRTVGNAYISKQEVGLGVTYSKVRQVRDYFLDKTYRREAGRTAFYENSYTAVNETETLFGEMEGVQFQTSLTDMWESVQELAKNPTNATNQGLLVSKAATFLERAQAVYSGLSAYQDNINEQVKDTVDTINEYGDKIYELNRKIVQAEAGGTEEANDLRDTRNQLLDELSGLVKITYSEDTVGSVDVSIEGTNFVTDGYVNKMGTTVDAQTGFYTPVWTSDQNSSVFDLTRPISSDLDTDIGGLKALVLARGDRRGTYKDIPKAPVSQTDLDDYNTNVSSSLIVNVMAEFDQLVNGIATGMNEILNPRVSDGAGGTTTLGFDLFVRYGIDDVTTPENPLQSTTWMSTKNLKINTTLLQQSTYLGCTKKSDGTYTNGFVTADNQENKVMADELTALFKNDFSSLNPNVNTAANFVGYYTNLVGQIANSGSVCKGLYDSQASTVESIESSRQQIVGVSDNEELTNMIKFQNAYNASSRYINAVNEMIGHIIEKLG
ncbi:MAG: flagellar hook-associated protein FlgK [Lachnospiraceae bacterium]|nr:flagellar hook-associated protein FlgK [Lachnospiraceae bacterium]